MTIAFRFPRTCASLMAGAACLALAACGGEAEVPESGITIIGSSTVYPFAQKVAEDTAAANEGFATPDIQSTGSTAGIAEFCKGDGPETADIVNASRRMTKAEFEACRASGVAEIIEIKVGRDGVVFTSALEDGLEFDMTSAIVYRALAASPFGEEQTAQNWSDVDGGLPAEAIIVYGPTETSGTQSALIELFMVPGCKTNGAMAALEESDPAAFRANCETLRSDSAYLGQGEQDELVVRKIANNARAIGIFGYSYLEENADQIKALSVGGVMPSAQTIADGSYPGSRPLYMYVKKSHIAAEPGIAQYLAQWAKSWAAGGALTAIGLVPATEDVQATSADAVTNQTVMTGEDLE